jgi:hypothetical protein
MWHREKAMSHFPFKMEYGGEGAPTPPCARQSGQVVRPRPLFQTRLDVIPRFASRQLAETHLSAMTQTSLHGGKAVYSTSISKL